MRRPSLTVALLLATFALFFAGPSRAQPAARKAVATKILLLGLDGADIEVVMPLIEAGQLPTLERLRDQGTMDVLYSHPPTRSPAVWTTIATGTRKEKHGIYDYVTSSYFWPEELRTREKNRTTSDMRKTKALWTLMTEQGRTTVVVGWLSTWPAEPIKGAMVAPYIDIGNTRQTTIKGSIYKTDAPRQTADPALFAELRPLLKDPDAFGPKDRTRFNDEPPADSAIYDKIKILRRYNYTASWSQARMHNVSAATVYLDKKLKPELVMSYFQCPDSFGHRFWHFRLSEQQLAERLTLLGADPAWAKDLKARYGQTIDNCYRYVDAEVARLLEALGPDTSIMIVSDHGFGGYQFDKVNKSVPFDGGHREQGLILLSGPAFIKGARLKSPWVEDVAPTVLQALAVPLPEGLDGRVLDEALVNP